MADKNELPEFSKKRKVLFDDKDSGRQRLQTGIAFKEAGRYDDALEFLARCDEPDAAGQIREIADIALQECNVPVYLRAKGILKEEPDPAAMADLAGNAEETGRPSMAVLAFQKSGMSEKAEEIRNRLLPDEASLESTEEENVPLEA